MRLLQAAELKIKRSKKRKKRSVHAFSFTLIQARDDQTSGGTRGLKCLIPSCFENVVFFFPPSEVINSQVLAGVSK